MLPPIWLLNLLLNDHLIIDHWLETWLCELQHAPAATWRWKWTTYLNWERLMRIRGRPLEPDISDHTVWFELSLWQYARYRSLHLSFVHYSRCSLDSAQSLPEFHSKEVMKIGYRLPWQLSSPLPSLSIIAHELWPILHRRQLLCQWDREWVDFRGPGLDAGCVVRARSSMTCHEDPDWGVDGSTNSYLVLGKYEVENVRNHVYGSKVTHWTQVVHFNRCLCQEHMVNQWLQCLQPPSN